MWTLTPKKKISDKIEHLQMGIYTPMNSTHIFNIYTHMNNTCTCTTHTTHTHSPHTKNRRKKLMSSHFFYYVFHSHCFLIPISIIFLITCFNNSVTRLLPLLPSSSQSTTYNLPLQCCHNNLHKQPS